MRLCRWRVPRRFGVNCDASWAAVGWPSARAGASRLPMLLVWVLTCLRACVIPMPTSRGSAVLELGNVEPADGAPTDAVARREHWVCATAQISYNAPQWPDALLHVLYCIIIML